MEFHDLLVSLLVGYAKALHELHTLHSLNKKLTISMIRTAWFMLCLLWDVTESIAYRMHLDSIQGRVPTVSYSSLDVYKEFSDGLGLGFHDATGMRVNVPDDHLDGLISELDAIDAELDSADVELMPPKLTFKSIILRQVAYSAATTLLSRYCTALLEDGSYNSNTLFTTHLIAVEQSEAFISWQGIKLTVDNIPVNSGLQDMVM